ncbi:MAG: lysylphosphatidylglycerol synthase transmembrane domain-containing protein [Bacteroidales bacterium]
MKKKILSVINYIFFLLIGLLFLWLAFRKVNIHQVLNEILQANYFWIGMAIIAAILSHIVRAMRWNLLINSLGYKTRTSTTFYAVMIGYMANMAVPRLGEVTRCGALSKKDNIPFNSLFGTVIAERVFDMIILIIIILGVIFFQVNLVGDFVNRTIIIPLFSNVERNYIPILFFVLILLGFIFLSVLIIRKYMETIRKLPFFDKISNFFKGLLEGVKTIKKIQHKWRFLGYTLLIWVFYSFMIYFPFYAMQGISGLNFGDAVTIMAIGSLGIVAPVPGGIGTYHFITKSLLYELYQIDPATATSFATLTHAAQAIMMLAIGALSFILIFMQNRRMTDGNAELY